MIELTGMTWEHSRGFDPMVATAKEYERTHPNVRIIWQQRSLQGFADVPMEEMAAKYDMMVIDHPHMGSAAQGKVVLALDQVGRDEELKLLSRQSVGPSYKSYEFEGHIWALAIDTATQVACYRPDLFEKPPTRWDEVVELAKQGQVIWPIKPVDSFMSFLTLAANRGTPCRTDGKPGPLLARGDSLAVLDALKSLADHVPRESLSMNPIQVYERMCADDRLAYCPLGYGYSNYSRPGYRSKLLKFTDIPALGDGGPRGSTIGGAGIAISARCKAKETAIDYAFWIAGTQCQKTLYFDSGGQPGNSAAWEDDRVNRACHDFFRNTRRTLDLTYLRPRYDGYLHLQDKGGNAVNAFLSSSTSADKTAQRIDEIYSESLSHR